MTTPDAGLREPPVSPEAGEELEALAPASIPNWPVPQMVADLMAHEAEAKRHAAEADRLRIEVKRIMLADGILTEQAGPVTVSIVETAAKLVIDDEVGIPAEFLRQKVEIDKERVKARLASGLPVRGARLEAGGPTLRISTRKK